MNTHELIRLIEPNVISEWLSVLYAQGLTLYKWRLSSTGGTKLSRPFILRAKGIRGECIIGDFPTIPVLLNYGWLAGHVLVHHVIHKTISFREISLTKPIQ